MFLKEKRDGSIKARGCADGRTQWEYTTKNEVSSTTVSLKAMMLSCAIDMKERKYVLLTVSEYFTMLNNAGILRLTLSNHFIL